MRIPKVDKEKCIACGLCPSIATNTFTTLDDGKAEVSNATGDYEALILTAIDSCPTMAITWVG